MSERADRLRRDGRVPEADAAGVRASPPPVPAVDAMPAAVREDAAGAGSALDAGTRAAMEGSFGHDFGHVRVHCDESGNARARQSGADAVTDGSDIFLGSPDFTPHSPRGRSLLAHELAHVVQQDRDLPGPTVSADGAEADARAAAEQVSSGHDYAVTVRAPAGVPLLQSVSAPPVEERTRARGTVRTALNPDLGRVTGRQRTEEGLEPGLPVDRSATEALLQQEIAALRPTMPEWTDAAGMGTFDSAFYGQVGPFDFRGHQMTGWEVNYYFVSMAMAHQGWDWNETQAIIWTWNSGQSAGIIPGGGEMTPEMWFAASEGFDDEQERMAQEARTPPPTAAPPAPSP